MIKELLTTLKLTGALEALADLSHIQEKESFLIGLLQAEKNAREQKASRRRLSQARFPIDKEWADIDPALNPAIDFERVRHLSTGDFVFKRQNLCLIGQQGTGKTHSLMING